jgi:hypothetical protein
MYIEFPESLAIARCIPGPHEEKPAWVYYLQVPRYEAQWFGPLAGCQRLEHEMSGKLHYFFWWNVVSLEIDLYLISAIVDLDAFSRRRECPPKYSGG